MKSVFKTVSIIMILTIFSRVLALVSNIVYMNYYGVNMQTDIYSYSLQLPNIIFNSFGTTLTTIIIPIFAAAIGMKEKERAFKFASNVITISVIFTVALTLLGWAFSPIILHFTKFRVEGYSLAIYSLRIMFPIVIFYALNYIFQGILQSLGKFTMPALVNLPGSLVVILYVLLLGNKFGVKGLVVATFIGLSMQAIILIPSVYSTGYKYTPSLDFNNNDIKTALKLIPPVIIGTSAYQINMFFNVTLSANFKDSVAIITMAQNLLLTGVLTLIYSMTAVLFPKFTVLAANNNMDEFKSKLKNTFDYVVFFLVPLTFGIILVSYEIINFLYGRGKFTNENVRFAGKILALYTIGILGIGIKEITDRVFYSIKNTKIPAFNGIIIVVVNIVASLILVRIFGVYGIPIAYSVSSITGGIISIIQINKNIGKIYNKKEDLIFVLKIFVSCIIMTAAAYGSIIILRSINIKYLFIDKSIKLLIPAGIGIIIYFVITYLSNVNIAREILKKVRR